MKELYDEVKRRGVNPAEILPATEYDVCIKRFEEICRNSPELANTDLSQWNLHQYLTTAYLLDALKSHDPDSLEIFKHWHKAVCLGSEFNPVNEGGSNFISAYAEAGKNLAEKHSFAGILIVWDEFGGALEDLLRNPNRNASGEILDLQRFVQTVCSPAQGHTIFIGLTHVSFPEYGDRMNCDQALKSRLETIFGRFKSFKIELSAAESEGYHLLGMQKSWNDYGKAQLNQFRANQENVVGVCSA
jgi:antitoxin component HigA of HigAB toxin-antitoxin module